MFSRDSPAALWLDSFLPSGDSLPRLGRRRLAVSVVAILLTATLFFIFVVPQLLRFRFQIGLTWYDLGIHGFGPSQHYVSFDKESPVVEISPVDAKCDPRYTFLAPRGDSVEHPGPMILDAHGELVWMKHERGKTQDFKVQRFKGQDYLTYWLGDKDHDNGRGSWHMLDSTYTPKFTISPSGPVDGDMHDFHITTNDTAILVVYEPIPYDLTSVGGPGLGWLYDGIVQEIDIVTGELLFEWRSSSFYPPEASYEPLGKRGHEPSLGYDYFHLNSVDKDDQGRYLISSRHAHTVTCVDGSTGEVLWTLGGKYNEFTDPTGGSATEFAWQHDARWQGANTLTLFNNAANGNDDRSAVSRGMLIELDVPARQATVLTTYDHPQDLMAVSQGNVQVLDTGNVLVGWGHSAAYTEFSADGDALCDVHFGASAYYTFGRVVSYRVFKGDWVGKPTSPPRAIITDDSVFVSWNGATEVAFWQLEAWDGMSLSNATFFPVIQVNRSGFETEIPLPSEDALVFRVVALDLSGYILGMTELLQRSSEFSMGRPAVFKSWDVMIMEVLSLACLLFCLCRAGVSWRRRGQELLGGGRYHLMRQKEDEEHDELPI